MKGERERERESERERVRERERQTHPAAMMLKVLKATRLLFIIDPIDGSHTKFKVKVSGQERPS